LKGIVVKSTGNLYTVKIDTNQKIDCKVKGNFRMKGILTSNPVAVGDVVTVEIPETNSNGYITGVDERRNHIIRKPSNWSKQVHIIAANIDQSLLVCTLRNPVTTTDFIDRYLVSAEAFRVPVIIVFNKIDIYKSEDLNLLDELTNLYSNIGYNVIKTSVNEDINISSIIEVLKNKTTLISGNSGVGKSTLINKLDNTFHAKTANISDYHKTGMHTTSFSEMFELANDGFVIDTPGLKGFGIVNIEKNELYHYFKDIFSVSKNCKFHNCLHINEPHCAVKLAVENKQIALSRYDSYLKLFFDDNEKYR